MRQPIKFYFILNMAFVIPVKNLGSFITTTFITQTSSAYNLHPHQRAAQYYYQGTLNHGKEPHRQHQCRKNPCYVCKGENSARPTSFFLQKAGTPFQYYCTKEGAFLLHNFKHTHLRALRYTLKAAEAFKQLDMCFADACALLEIIYGEEFAVLTRVCN